MNRIEIRRARAALGYLLSIYDVYCDGERVLWSTTFYNADTARAAGEKYLATLADQPSTKQAEQKSFCRLGWGASLSR